MLSHAWEMIKETLSRWSDNNAQRMSAALAYYTLFSLAPLLVIAIAVAGVIFSRGTAESEVMRQLTDVLGAKGARAVQRMIVRAGEHGAGVVATVIGVVVGLIGATGVFAELQRALNDIWGVRPAPSRSVRNFIRARLLSFAMVLGIGFLLLVSLILGTVISAMVAYFGQGAVWEWVNFGVSFAIFTLLFAMIYKVLPDTRVAWRDVWMGSLITALLFVVGKFLLGLYLSRGTVTSIFGVAGSLVVLLVWVYYSAQILFLGAEFTCVYAQHRETRARAPEPAEPTPPDARPRYPAPTYRPHPAVARCVALAAAFAAGRVWHWRRRQHFPSR